MIGLVFEKTLLHFYRRVTASSRLSVWGDRKKNERQKFETGVDAALACGTPKRLHFASFSAPGSLFCERHFSRVLSLSLSLSLFLSRKEKKRKKKRREKKSSRKGTCNVRYVTVKTNKQTNVSLDRTRSVSLKIFYTSVFVALLLCRILCRGFLLHSVLL